MIVTKDRIIMEVEKIPKDKFSELYEILHLFRIGAEKKGGATTDRQKAALKFFGIWKDMSSEEIVALDEIQLRRKKTFRERIL
jgi:hypothetical protein